MVRRRSGRPNRDSCHAEANAQSARAGSLQQPPYSGGRFDTSEKRPSGWRTSVGTRCPRCAAVQAPSESESEQTLDEGGPKTYFFRRMPSPRWLERNPYMPDHSSSFLAWAGAGLNPEGQTLYTPEIIFAAP